MRNCSSFLMNINEEISIWFQIVDSSGLLYNILILRLSPDIRKQNIT